MRRAPSNKAEVGQEVAVVVPVGDLKMTFRGRVEKISPNQGKITVRLENGIGTKRFHANGEAIQDRHQKVWLEAITPETREEAKRREMLVLLKTMPTDVLVRFVAMGSTPPPPRKGG